MDTKKTNPKLSGWLQLQKILLFCVILRKTLPVDCCVFSLLSCDQIIIQYCFKVPLVAFSEFQPEKAPETVSGP